MKLDPAIWAKTQLYGQGGEAPYFCVCLQNWLTD